MIQIEKEKNAQQSAQRKRRERENKAMERKQETRVFTLPRSTTPTHPVIAAQTAEIAQNAAPAEKLDTLPVQALREAVAEGQKRFDGGGFRAKQFLISRRGTAAKPTGYVAHGLNEAPPAGYVKVARHWQDGMGRWQEAATA